MRLLLILLLVLQLNSLKADEINYLLKIPSLEVYKLKNINRIKYLSAKKNFRIGIDDGTDKLEIGAGTAHGTTAAITIDSSADNMILNF